MGVWKTNVPSWLISASWNIALHDAPCCVVGTGMFIVSYVSYVSEILHVPIFKQLKSFKQNIEKQIEVHEDSSWNIGVWQKGFSP